MGFISRATILVFIAIAVSSSASGRRSAGRKYDGQNLRGKAAAVVENATSATADDDGETTLGSGAVRRVNSRRIVERVEYEYDDEYDQPRRRGRRPPPPPRRRYQGRHRGSYYSEEEDDCYADNEDLDDYGIPMYFFIFTTRPSRPRNGFFVFAFMGGPPPYWFMRRPSTAKTTVFPKNNQTTVSAPDPRFTTEKYVDLNKGQTTTPDPRFTTNPTTMQTTTPDPRFTTTEKYVDLNKGMTTTPDPRFAPVNTTTVFNKDSTATTTNTP